MKTISENSTVVFNSKGEYIRFGGQGILDGLKQVKCKVDFYLIIGATNESHDITGLVIKRYRAKHYSILPFYCFRQEYEIINKKEFSKLPVYGS